MGRNRACPARFQGGASRPERQVRKEGVYAIIRRQAENEGAGERQSFVVAEKRAPRPFWKILYMVGVLMAAAASSPAQGRLVLRSELITESHFCHFRQNHNTIKI